jgi:hypothetical protein
MNGAKDGFGLRIQYLSKTAVHQNLHGRFIASIFVDKITRWRWLISSDQIISAFASKADS